MKLFYVKLLFVCVDVAWLILTLQVIALSHYSLSLVQMVGSLFFFSKLLCTDVMFLHWNKANCCHQVFYFECLCSERVDGVYVAEGN